MPFLPLDWRQQTRASRVIIAVLVGATASATIDAALVFIQLRAQVGVIHTNHYLADKSREVFVYAFIIFLVGIVVFGLPVWRALHTTGRRAWFHAVIAGATVPFVVYLALSTGFFTGHANGNWSYYGDGGKHWVDGVITMFGVRMAVQNAAQLGLMGALVGLVIWRVAYRRES
jgi:uncharacterized membrane protein YiaA